VRCWKQLVSQHLADGVLDVCLSRGSDGKGHPEERNVMLRIMSLSDAKRSDGKISCWPGCLEGRGQSTLPSWSPGQKEVAFVSYACAGRKRGKK